MSKAAAKRAPESTTITPGEMRIEIQLEGFRSVVSAGFLVMAQSAARQEALLERIAKGIEAQTKLLTGANGHANAEHASEEDAEGTTEP